MPNRHQRVARVTYVHNKSDGSAYEITGDFCEKTHLPRVLATHVVRETDVARTGQCTVCHLLPFRRTRALGSPWNAR